MTQAGATSAVACPGCGTRYRWRDEFAGKELNCRCGTAFRPSMPAGAATAGALPPRAAEAAAIVAKHGYLLGGGGKSPIERALEERVDDAQPSRARDVVVPLIALPVGAFAAFVLWSNITNGGFGSVALVWLGSVALQAVLFLPLALTACALVAKWMELGLGPLPTVLLKCAALTLGLAAVGDAALVAILVNTDFDWSSVVAAFAIYFALCGLPAMFVFEMAVYEAALWVFLTFIPRIAAGFVLVPPLARLFE